MQIRPYRLSQIPCGDFSLVGYSVAGEETVILAPELDVAFDIGKCPREALTVSNVLLTHGHADHSVGVIYYFAQRFFQGMDSGRVLLPANLVEPMIALMKAWARVEGNLPPYDFVPVRPGDDIEIRRGLVARAFRTNHLPGSLGFSLIDVRHKLKEEYQGLEGPQIVELKNKGVEITRRIEVPLVAYLGDTAPGDYIDRPEVKNAQTLLIECTFFDDDHQSRARAGKHIHIDDLPNLLSGTNNERIVVTHVTRRTNMPQARRVLKKKLPSEIVEKLTFLMSRKHAEE